MSSGLITPNFSTDSLGRHTEYIEGLSRKYATLSKLVLEERPSESPYDEVDEDRILALRERIQEAWSRADGNPASGKWVVLSRLLRMGTISGRGAKWVGARADLKSPECPENGWLSTMSESDWSDWERKFIQDQNLKNMVETWKRGVKVRNVVRNVRESHATRSQMDTLSHRLDDSRRPGKSLQKESGVSSDKQNTKYMPTASMDPLKDSAPFGFTVVKRSTQTNLKGKIDVARNKIPDGPDLLAVSETPGSSKGAEKGSSRRSKGQTSHVAELSSMHLSFSEAQLLTSTPKQTAKPTTTTSLVAQPEVSSPLTPLSSSHGQRALLGRVSSLASAPGQSKTRQNDQSNRVAIAVSLSMIPSLDPSLRHTTSQPADYDPHDSINSNNKRSLDSSHSYPVTGADGRKLKKARTSSSENADALQTPPRHRQGRVPTAVPTLTELLASVKKAKRKHPSAGKPQISEKKNFAHKSHPLSSDPRLEARTHADGRIQTDFAVEERDPFFDPSPVNDGTGGNIQESGSRVETGNPEHKFYSHLNNFSAPAKSLSSIAGASDGEEEVVGPATAGDRLDEFVLDSSFRPLATSTQVRVDDELHGGPLVSKPNSSNPVITQPNDPTRSSGKGGHVADSWENIYAADHSPPGLSVASVKNKNDDSLFPPLSYDSQFESAVAAQVEKVNKLLQRDVGYEGLLSDSPAKNGERNEDFDDSGSFSLNGGSGSIKGERNEYGYSYGKAFQYDQSF